MLPTDLPECQCIEGIWFPSGARQEGDMFHEAFNCGRCKAVSLYLCGHHCNAFFMQNRTVKRQKMYGLTPEEDAYIGRLWPIWKEFGDRKQQVQQRISQEHRLQALDALSKLPEDQRAQFDSRDRTLYARADYIKPPGFERSPMPPGLPVSLKSYQHVLIEPGRYHWEELVTR